MPVPTSAYFLNFYTLKLNIPQASLHFDKDGISLWLVALRNSGPIQQTNGNPPGLFNLLPVLVTVLANNVDLLGSVIDIATSYYLLNATYVLQVGLFWVSRASI